MFPTIIESSDSFGKERAISVNTSIVGIIISSERRVSEEKQWM
jgi:hypothetical protein